MVVDDEFLAIKLLGGYIEQTAGLQLLLKTTDPAGAIEAILQSPPALLFLDIEMPGITGIDLVRIIQHTGTKVIFTTAYAQYALDGYEYDVVDYLLKPITFARFLVAVNKAKKRIHELPVTRTDTPPAYIFVKTEYRLQKVMLADILYLEGLRDYIAVHTTTGKILSLERMKNMEGILPPNIFLRIHKSYIVNIHNIDYLERGRIIINKEYLPIGETYKEAVRGKLDID